ncbi:MAG: YdbH domain-containing protein [Nitrincola sp.]|nr:YdbH domain-containing protein [Nitrincola sp.]
MLKKLIWILLFLIFLILSLAASLYWFSPQLTRIALVHWLEQQGFESIEFQMHPPTDNRLLIHHLALSQTDGQRHLSVNVQSLELHYDLMTLIQAQRLHSLSMDQVDILIQIDTSLPERIQTLQQQSIDLHPQQLTALFAEIPAQSLKVQQINISYQADAAPSLNTSGQLSIDPQGLTSHWELFINQAPLADLTANLSLDGQLSLALSQQQDSLINIAGELTYLEDHWHLALGHQIYTHQLITWLNRSFSLALSQDIGLQDPLSFTAQLKLPRELPLDPTELLDALDGELTLATQILPERTTGFPYRLELDLLTQLQLTQRQITGQLQVSAREMLGELPSVELRSRLSLNHSLDTLSLNGHLSIDDLNQLISFSTELSADTPTRINWQIANRDAIPVMTLLKSYFEAIPPAILLESGQFNASGNLTLNSPNWSLSGRTQLSNATVLYANTRFEGVDWTSQLRADQTGNWSNNGDLALDRLNIGLPIRLSPINYQLRHQANQLRLSTSALTAELLGGRIYIPALNFDPSAPDLLFLVSLREFDLGQILALYADKGLYGEGSIDGQLPIQFNANGLRIDGGNVGTTAPGVIRYQPDDGLQAMAAGNIGLRLAFEALSDLQYQLLDLDVHYEPNGDLTLRSRLKGNNPDWQQGRPIDLTLTIEDNIPDLLRALQITGRITDAVDRHFQR